MKGRNSAVKSLFRQHYIPKYMKTLIAAITFSIGFILSSVGDTTNQSAVVGIVDVDIQGKGDTNLTTGMTMRIYTVTLDTFYSNLRRKIVPKDGESNIDLLRRFFVENHIDLANPKAAVAMNEKLGKLFVMVI